MNISNYDLELKRKIFHCISIIFPIIYLFNTKLSMVIILMISTAIVLAIDISRHYNKKIQDTVDKLFLPIMRTREISGSFELSGVSYMFLGFFITCVLFSKGTAISAFLVLIISDTAAAIVGQKAGSDFKNGKSIEGSLAFCITALLISMLSYTFHSYNATFKSIILASIITTIAEYYANTIKINDNLLIPIVYGTAISILGFFV